MHDGQLVLEDRLAVALISASVPEADGMPVRRLPSPGTVNALFRIGDGLVARFPLVSTDLAEVRAEAERMTEFAEISPVPAPRPVRVLEASAEYPSAWMVASWVDGETAEGLSDARYPLLAGDLARLIVALRSEPLRGRAFDGTGRGGELTDHDDWVEECFDRSGHLLDVDAGRAMWARLRSIPHPGVETMSHRDLTPPNLIVSREGRLTGVLDTGSFGPVDPSLDLVAAWHLLDAEDRAVLRSGVGSDDAEWRRGAAWALQQAMGLGWYYERTNPAMARLGLRTMGRLLAAEELRG
ncbi:MULTISPECIES: phosphotransferase [unclassified Microbacterium]|uniref:phosphotransferase n=1 Tax=unclassified Microbacterium TaxID=2609290 RepID=UPI0012FB047D|nr:phosphotransferase [Microbacterium sp. MAH-37]MVQ41877.1 phosphotransferase [Microbacterium sp. MAH-37]